MPAKNNLGGESRGYAWTIANGKVRWEADRLERTGYFDTLLEEGRRSLGERDDEGMDAEAGDDEMEDNAADTEK